MDQTTNIRILIADDQEIIRSAMEALLKSYPDLKIVGSAASGREALDRLRDLDGAVDVALLDVDMPEMDGIRATREIHETWPNCAVLLLTSYPQFSNAGVQAGARGYLLKATNVDELIAAIHAVARGSMYLQSWNAKSPEEPLLSDTERKILGLMAESATNQEIGQRSGYAESTVRAHVATIIRKLGANGREHAVLLAMRRGLLR